MWLINGSRPQVLGQLRIFLAQRPGLIPRTRTISWVIDFPLLAYDAADKDTLPITILLRHLWMKDLPLLDQDPLKVRSQAYDLVYNGVEVAGKCPYL